MTTLPRELRDLIEAGPMAHVTTLNADGSPQVSVVWVGLDGDDLVTGHLHHGAKLRNVERDPRTVVSVDSNTPNKQQRQGDHGPGSRSTLRSLAP